MNPVVRRFVVPLHPHAKDVAHVGGKALSLGRLEALGFDVPPGFVVTNDAFQAFVAHHRLSEPIDELARAFTARDVDRIRALASVIRSLVLAGRLSDGLSEELARARATLRFDRTLAVRSSAVGEDSKEASFAGQLDTILDVDAAGVERAILACWASFWNERALLYQLSRGVNLSGMAVVVQEMVPAAIAGVLFTEGPNLPGRMLGEFCYGLGDALVSGAINPGRFTIDRLTLGWEKLALPEPTEGRDREPDGVDASRSSLLFSGGRLRHLATSALRLEVELGGAQDIEWVIGDDDRTYFVQARPITAPATPKASLRPTGRPRDEDVVWSNANVNENFPDPISPFLYSIVEIGYYHYFKNLGIAFGISSERILAMEHALRHIVGVHGCRLYYNLTNLHAVLHEAPFGEILTDCFDEFVGIRDKLDQPAEDTNPKSDGLRPSRGPFRGAFRGGFREWTRNGRDLLEVANVAVQTTLKYARLEGRIRAFEQIADAFASRCHPSVLAKSTTSELLGHLRGFIDIRCQHWTNASLADAAAMVSYGLLRRVLGAALPDQPSLHHALLKGLPDIASSRPVERLWDVSRMIRREPELVKVLAEETADEVWAVVGSGRFPRVHRAIEAYLEECGFRGSGELMLTRPSLQEEPARLFDILRTYVEIDGPSPAEAIRRQGLEREAATERLRAALAPTRAFRLVPGLSASALATVLLSATHSSIAFRERARLKQALLYSRLRRIMLAIGQRLVSGGNLRRVDDVFFLTHQEVDALLSSSAMFSDVRELVELRRRAHERASTMVPPDTVVLEQGRYLSQDSLAPREAATEATEAAERAATLNGVGTCGGRVTGRAKIMHDMSEAQVLEAGDILVTRQTDPGWAPVFFVVRGLVMERGGMLSHGAIIAREFGIPAVVGIKDATRIVANGARVMLDGDLGHVQILG